MSESEASTTMAGRTGRGALFAALLSELQQPSIAIFEDMHWADEATLDMLTFAGRRI